jgi:hypothetical protein
MLLTLQVRPASEDETSKLFTKGVWLIKFDSYQAQWRELTYDRWSLIEDQPVCVMVPSLCSKVRSVHDRHLYESGNSLEVPSVDDRINFSTNRPLKDHLPLVREYYL